MTPLGCPLGRVENSIQNQMSQCFFIGLYDIETGDDFYFFQKKILIGGNIPDICHGRHGRRPCKFFLAGVNFYRFNAKNWQFTV